MPTATQPVDAVEEIIQLERKALERWGKGDPDGFLEVSAPDVTYFDPFVERRLDGIDALRKLYDDLRGKIAIDSSEMVTPSVQLCGSMAVLTYQFISRGSEGTMKWNTTEVYRRDPQGWRIVHTHWALTGRKG